LSTGNCVFNQAGLLTPGSTYLLRLPNITISGLLAVFVTGYSGGPVPEFTGFPFHPPKWNLIRLELL